ncbi:MAG: protein kinase [Myxococcota bacterium]
MPSSPPGGYPAVGSTVGGWFLKENLGSGGIAAVFLAERDDGQRAAVKVLHPSSIGTDEVRRFEREYRALQRMSHPNIVQVFEAGVLGSYPWLAMEFVDGTDLDEQIAQWETDNPADRWAQVEVILRGLCEALGYLHTMGLVHRDLKPSNVLLTADGQVKLADFGVVKDSRAQTTALTMHGNLVGTVAFMAPEHIMDEPVGPRSDLYSLGAVLYVLLTGKRPIEASSITGFLARHLTHVPTAPSTIRPDVPRPLEAICQRLLYKDRKQRFQSAEAVIRALDDAADPDAVAMRGRDELVGAWHERLSRLQQGEGGVVAITGAPLTGTSFALHRLMDVVDVRQARTIGAQQNPITDLARGLGVDVGSEPAARHLRLLAEAIRGAPTVLAVDDLHLAEPRMVTALARLVRKLVVQEAEPLLLVYCVTEPIPERLAELHEGLASSVAPSTWSLRPIARPAVAAQLRDLGIRGAVSGVLARRLHRELFGRPGAVAQAIEALHAQGWLSRKDGGLVAEHSPSHFAKAPLPIPSGPRLAIQRQLQALRTDLLHVIEVMAVVAHPVDPQLLRRITDAPGSAIDDLVLTTLVSRTTTEQGDRVQIDMPWAAAVILQELPDGHLERLHKSVAVALGSSRRRSDAQEVAHHYERAGELQEAWPLYLRAARNAARSRDYVRVLAACEGARRTEPEGMAAMAPEEAKTLQIQRLQLTGESELARGQWQAAAEPLEQAAEVARNLGNRKLLSRVLQGQGRAWYRMGHFSRARAPLVESLRHGETGDPERSPALRALADILLRDGKIEQSERLWNEALSTARAADSTDGEARALRGIAHLRTLQGRLEVAADSLDRADDLLRGSTASRVHAAVLARSVELDLAAGRYDRAQSHVATLADLVDRKNLEQRSVEAGALHALSLLRAGDNDGARRSLSQVEPWSRSAAWDSRILVARLRCILGPDQGALDLLPGREELPEDTLYDAPAQATAIRARALAPTQPERARDLAQWCLGRPPPRLILRHVDILMDAGEALLIGGDRSAAREAAKVGLRNLSGPGADGLRLELLSLFHRADPDPRILAAFKQVADRVCAQQPPSIGKALSKRPGFGPALA